MQGGVSGHTVRVGPRAHQRPEPGCCGVVYDDASEGGERAGCIQGKICLPHPVRSGGKGDAIDAEHGVSNRRLMGRSALVTVGVGDAETNGAAQEKQDIHELGHFESKGDGL